MKLVISLFHTAVGFLLGAVRNRSQAIERWLQITMPEREADAVIEACHGSGVTIGAFYGWYWYKARIAQLLRAHDASALLGLVKCTDQTDYAPLDAVASISNPLILAIPHYGHYVLAMIGIIERLRVNREVMIFYADPKARPGNAMFDAGIRCSYWSNENSGVHVLHDDRAGLAEALRGLRLGRVLIIMPDVARNSDNSYLIPFFGRAMGTMLGTATLSRKTGATILPLTAVSPRYGLRFATRFGDPLSPQHMGLRDPHATLLADYTTTCNLFTAIETLIGGHICRWQFIREHFSSGLKLSYIEPEQLTLLTDSFLSSSRASLHGASALPIS